ncbi:MAG: hypothetical protein N2595_02155 [bacterium]|nr:hypothetical protein [bacterium]
MTRFATNGQFNQTRVAFWKPAAQSYNVYTNSGIGGGVANQTTGLSSFDGEAFDRAVMTNAAAGNWQANDMRFYTYDGTRYLLVNGTGAGPMRQWVVGDESFGYLGSYVNVTNTAAQVALIQDFAWSPSGRLILLTTNGIWVSAPGSWTSTANSVTRVFVFGAAENATNGHMGANARELLLLEDRL